MRISLILSLVISLLAVAFALVNNEPVTVNLGVTTFEGSLALILLITLGLGALVGILASLPGRFKAQKRARSLERSLAEYQKESSRSRSEESPASTE